MISVRKYRSMIRWHLKNAREEKIAGCDLYFYSIERIRAMWQGR